MSLPRTSLNGKTIGILQLLIILLLVATSACASTSSPLASPTPSSGGSGSPILRNQATSPLASQASSPSPSELPQAPSSFAGDAHFEDSLGYQWDVAYNFTLPSRPQLETANAQPGRTDVAWQDPPTTVTFANDTAGRNAPSGSFEDATLGALFLRSRPECEDNLFAPVLRAVVRHKSASYCWLDLISGGNPDATTVSSASTLDLQMTGGNTNSDYPASVNIIWSGVPQGKVDALIKDVERGPDLYTFSVSANSDQTPKVTCDFGAGESDQEYVIASKPSVDISGCQAE